jgi:hypothetical protein
MNGATKTASPADRAIAFATKRGEGSPFAESLFKLPSERIPEAARVFRFLEKVEEARGTGHFFPLKYLLTLAMEGNERSQRFCLMGGFASFMYITAAEGELKGPTGKWRGSHDLDIIAIDRGFPAMAAATFGTPLIKAPFPNKTAVNAYDEHAEIPCEMDIYHFEDGKLRIEEYVLKEKDLRTVTFERLGVEFRVLSWDQLVSLKAYANRLRDKIDVVDLVCALAKADERGTSGELGGSLEKQFGRLTEAEREAVRKAFMEVITAKNVKEKFGGIVPYYSKQEIIGAYGQIEGL